MRKKKDKPLISELFKGFEIYEKDYNDLRDLVADLPEWKASNVSKFIKKLKKRHEFVCWSYIYLLKITLVSFLITKLRT